jgi:hypothetical protein
MAAAANSCTIMIAHSMYQLSKKRIKMQIDINHKNFKPKVKWFMKMWQETENCCQLPPQVTSNRQEVENNSSERA